MSWNLISRAANTASICYGHLEWREDALCVYFAHMKNDQRGSGPRDPRHVYANPTSPEIGPILALGMYWASYGGDVSETHLFPGNDQYERFRKVLGRVLKTSSIATELVRRGSTACPPAVAVHLRAGWAMGGVHGRYLRHDAAGDMFVGRTFKRQSGFASHDYLGLLNLLQNLRARAHLGIAGSASCIARRNEHAGEERGRQSPQEGGTSVALATKPRNGRWTVEAHDEELTDSVGSG
ncbi:hypothetical protein ON010_g261 [Phytophthora cinnamomi]|nr:hypothetical protein ON010_g261 [Phytophthora cinnamomi]